MTHQPIQATIREDDADTTIQVSPGPLSDNALRYLQLLQQYYTVTQTGVSYEFVHKRIARVRAIVTVTGALPHRVVVFNVAGSVNNAADASALISQSVLFSFIQSLYE